MQSSANIYLFFVGKNSLVEQECKETFVIVPSEFDIDLWKNKYLKINVSLHFQRNMSSAW